MVKEYQKVHFAPAVKCAASPSVIHQGQGLVFFGSHVGSEVVLCLSLTGVSGGGTTQLSELMDRKLRRGLGHLKHHRMTWGHCMLLCLLMRKFCLSFVYNTLVNTKLAFPHPSPPFFLICLSSYQSIIHQSL